ncbi:MAG: zinc-dependent metalloprotease [Acidimicrobiales bacterium]
MSDLPNFGGDMFKNMMNDIMRLMPSGGGMQWGVAYQLASQIAAGETGSEPNPDPLERIRFEELSNVAQLHVSEVIGMSVSPAGENVKLLPASRGDWAKRILDTWLPVLERLTAAAAPESAQADSDDSAGPDPAPAQPSSLDPFSGRDEDGGEGDAMMEVFGRFFTAMAPTMTAMQAGSVAGHLAERAIGQYDVPLAPVASSELLVVTANLDAVAEDWSLPIDGLRLWLCAHEMACHAVLSRPGIATRIADLVVAHARLAQPDPASVQQLMSEADPSDPMALSRVLSDPGNYAAGALSGKLGRIRGDLDAITAAVSGYVEHVTGIISERAIGNYAPIGEAMRRRRVSRGEGEKVAEALFGLSLDQGQIDRGERFVAGVVQRGGEVQLTKMWSDPRWLPTPTEIEAPGLWLARVELPGEPGGEPAESQP